MITKKDFERKEIYKQILAVVKRELPLPKRLFKNSITEEEAGSLQRVTLENIELKNVDFLRYFRGLKELNLRELKGVTDVRGLRYCTELKELEFYNAPAEYLQEVQFCRNLTYFCYAFEEKEGEQRLSDFSFLKGLEELEVVCITNNRVTDPSVFADFHKVRHLILEGNPLTSIEPLKAMRSLTQLELEECGLSALEGIEEFTALKVVFLEDNMFTAEQREAYQAKCPHIELDFEN
ncbi:MAG: hypothetical protein IJ379_02100 [Lachnospiraceae bacterium]|nr:hypothetical protein [Lachnospiraceae bacterium]